MIQNVLYKFYQREAQQNRNEKKEKRDKSFSQLFNPLNTNKIKKRKC